jgi:hypothetical protein
LNVLIYFKRNEINRWVVQGQPPFGTKNLKLQKRPSEISLLRLVLFGGEYTNLFDFVFAGPHRVLIHFRNVLVNLELVALIDILHVEILALVRDSRLTNHRLAYWLQNLIWLN